MSGTEIRVDATLLQGHMQEVLHRAGAAREDAQEVAENLIWNDLASRTFYGIHRLPVLCRRVRVGLIRSPARMTFTQTGTGAGRLDAGDGFGQVAGARAVDHAIAMAQSTGLGAVAVKASNFFGTGAFFAARAAQANMLSLVLSNSVARVAAHGGHRPVLGTNPFAFGAPRRDGRALLLDMATAASAGSSFRESVRLGLQLPEGVAVDAQGTPITDPALAAKGTLLPAAGAKGFGLALMVEVLAGVLSGAAMSTEVGSLYADFDRPGNSGHFVIVLDVARFMPMESYFDRLEAMVAMVGTSDPGGKVRMPGEARWDAIEHNRRAGIRLDASTRAAVEALGNELGVALPWREGVTA